jgi:hypothetical protein
MGIKCYFENRNLAWVDHGKMEPWKEITSWFFNTKPKGDRDTPLLLQQILEAGAGILRISEVTVHPPYRR